MEDINIIFKPTIDTKEVNKEMQQIAKTSQTAIEQSFKSLDLTMRKSIEAWGGDLSKVGKNVNIDAFIGDFQDKMAELYDSIRETGNMPLGMSSKMLDVSQQVENLIRQYQKLGSVIESIPDADKFVETTRYTKLTEQIRELGQEVGSSTSRVERLKEALSNATQREKLVSSLEYQGLKGEEVVEHYNKRIAKIEELEEKIRELKRLQGADPARGINRGLFGTELEQNQKQVSDLQKQLDDLYRSMRTFGNERTAMISKINSLGPAQDVEKLNQDLKDAEGSLAKVTEKYNGLIAKREQLEASGGRYTLSDDFTKSTGEMRRLEVEIVKAASRMNELEQASVKSAQSMSQMRNVVWSISRVLGNVYTIGLDLVRGAKQIADSYMKIWNIFKNMFVAIKRLRENIKKTNDEHKKSWKQMLKDVIRYSLGIRSLFMLFRRLRGYIKEAFKAMAEQIPEVNQTLSELKSSFNMLKGSLATAFEPLISAIAPALVRLINLFATLLTYVGMFFAAITGRGYVYKANKSMTSFADAAGGAADNVKELNKQLQGFDELNNLTTNENKDAGGAGAGPLANFEKVPVLDWIKDLADKIREIFERIMEPIKRAWAKVGDYVVAAWKRAFMSVRDLLLDIGRDFLRAWDEIGESIATHFFLILGDIGHIIANIADSLREAWNYNENGYKIWMAILTIIDKVLAGIRRITKDMRDWSAQLNVTPAMTSFREWLESCEPVVDTFMGILFDLWDHALKPILNWAFDGEDSGIARLFKIFKDFNEKVDWDKLRSNLDKVWKAVGRFGQTVGKGLLLFIERLSDRLADWVNSDDFEKTMDKIAEFLDNIEPEDIADDLDSLLTDVENLAKAIKDVIKYVWDHKDEILKWLELITKYIDMIIVAAAGFKLVIDLARLAANIYLMATAFKKLAGAGGIAGLGDVVATHGGSILSFFTSLAVVLGTVAAGYALAKQANEELIPVLEENEKKFQNLKSNVDDTIPTYDEMSQAAREASRNQKEYAQHMQEMYDAVLKAHPELQELSSSLEDNGFKTQKNIDTLTQINEGLQYLKQNGGDVKDAMDHLSETYDKVDKHTEQFFNSLEKGKPKAEEVAKSMGYLADETEKFGADTVKGYNRGIEENQGTTQSVIQTWAQKIKSWFHDSDLQFGSPSQTLIEFGRDTILGFNQGIIDNQYSTFTIINNFANTIVNTFATMRNNIINVFNGLASDISTILSNIVSAVSGVFDSISSSISGLKSGINGFTGSIGSKFNIHIPKLAQGAVIPPNNEFLAVLGDQKRGTNIESPLSTMVEAFNMANKGGSEQEIALLQEQNDLLRQLLQKEFGISNEAIFKSVRQSNSQYRKQTGTSAFA